MCDRQGRRLLPNWHQHNRVRVHFGQLEAWRRTLDQLLAAKEVHLVTLRLEGRDAQCGVNGGSPDERRVLKALKPSELRPPEPPKGEECVM